MVDVFIKKSPIYRQDKKQGKHNILWFKILQKRLQVNAKKDNKK